MVLRWDVDWFIAMYVVVIGNEVVDCLLFALKEFKLAKIIDSREELGEMVCWLFG